MGAGVVLALIVLLLVAAGVAFARFMVPIDDVPRDPDAVVVLGGAGDERARLGLQLAERYDAQLVLSSNARFFAAAQGATCERDAICFEPEPANTVGEARNVAALAEQYGWEHVTVATSDFHTTRTRYLFRQCLGDRVTVVGASRDDRPRIAPRLLLREALGVIAGATIERAC
ncbi:MAG: YdcF family protein [Nitriliruptoraceae bacterium]